MVKIAENKFYTENKPIESLPAPALVYIPLSQHLGKPCEPSGIKAGDKVLVGQKIATAAAQPFAPVHASVSGTVRSIQPWPHPVLGTCRTIVIENDFQDAIDSGIRPRGADEVNKLGPKEIREIVFNAGIVGMGGASFPTHIKLNPPQQVHTLIVNIAECEPYLTGDSQLTVEKTSQVISGIKVIGTCFPHLQRTIIAIEDNKPEAAAALKRAMKGTPYTLSLLRAHYPQGGEKQLIKKVLNIEVPRAKLPFDVGVNVQNVSTVFAVHEAVYSGKPLYERVVTVSGRCLSGPKNLLCRIGTPLQELIKYCGPISGEPAKVITGGPMMGIAQYTDSVPVIKSTTGVVIFDDREARTMKESPCIRCGACVRECPMGLAPCLINQASVAGAWQQAKELGCLDCIECGLCNYVCPAQRQLVQSIKRAKPEAK